MLVVSRICFREEEHGIAEGTGEDGTAWLCKMVDD